MASGNAVIILGMHRSGTSCLTGCLEEAGLYLGDVATENPDNAKGNRESERIMALHKAIMSDSWKKWKDEIRGELKWKAKRLAERDAIIAGYPPDRMWGFKDPRTVFTLSGWLDALPEARLVGSIRHPHAVALSLAKRNGFDLARGYDIWLSYNRRLKEICETRDVRLVSFDWPLSFYERVVRALCAELGLSVPDRFSFIESDLRHNSGDGDAPIPSEVAELYGQLQSMLIKVP